MKNPRMSLAVAAVLFSSQFVRADVIELKTGQVLNGDYAGGTAGTVRFEVDGTLQVFELSQIVALTFTGGSAPTPSAPAAITPSPVPVAKPTAETPVEVTLPAGTSIVVRTIDGITSNDSRGKRFAASLEGDLVAHGKLVAKAGTKVYGRVESAQQAGRYAGQSRLDLRLTDISSGGVMVPIVTGSYAESGSRTGSKVLKSAAAGAAIGAIADDSAGKGAAIGAVASGLRRGEAITIRPGSLLKFQLQQGVKLASVR